MSATRVLINLLGEVALLLWGIQMVSVGVQRALGSNLRRLIAIGLRDRWRAFAVGLGMTSLLQSSTATALMVSSLAAGGAVDLVPALATMLGANVGTTLIVQAMSFDISLVFPLLIFAGVVAYRSGHRAILRDAGMALVGLGLMLLALHLLVGTMQPVESSHALREFLHSVTFDPLLNVLLAALLSWAAHSSVAAMLFIISLAGAGVINADAAVAMVIGANLGSALNPLVDAIGKDRTRLRLPVGNLVNRLVGCLLFVPFVPTISAALISIGETPSRAAANFHLLFNVVLAGLFIAILPLVARMLTRAFPTSAHTGDLGAPQYLDESALSAPTVAVSNAAREVLRMADVVEAMLRGSRSAFRLDDRDKVAEISAMDDVLDRLFGAIQRYLGKIDCEALNEEAERRVAEILALAINLEHIGDVIDKNLMELAAKRIKHQLKLPTDSILEIETMHERLLNHLQLAVAVFMFGDAQAARRLVVEKEEFRAIERAATERHFVHMRAGQSDQIEMSALQLDVTRDLKRIEAHMASTVYGLLEEAGQLRTSRLSAP
ncbi:MAG: Na/Pi cotransporter family protein [Microvirga sp.]